MRLPGVVAAAVRCTLVAVVLAGAASVSLPAPAQAATPGLPVPSPLVTGPLRADSVGSPSRNYPFGASTQNLAKAGYVEHEFFFSGLAAGQPYTSRLLVRRPANPARFSGTVVTEWTNVSNGFDVDCLWGRSSEQVLRDGDAYVAVDAQSVGVHDPATGLKAFNPKRYRDLNIPTTGTFVAELGSYDIFAQALKAIREPGAVKPLGPLKVRQQLATGCSQSAATLSIFAGTSGALQRLVDGYLITMLSTSSIDLPPAGLVFPVPTPQLLGVPVFQLNTETDEGHLVRQPDGPNYRLWEVAGTSHEDADLHEHAARVFRRDFGRPLPAQTCTLPPHSRVPFAHAQNAALKALKRWAAGGAPPSAAPQLAYSSSGDIVRDRYGNAAGGIRLPEHQVATATNSSINGGSTVCAQLYGSYRPFSRATLRSLYRSHDAYVAAVQRQVKVAVEAGFLLPADAASTMAAARAARVP